MNIKDVEIQTGIAKKTIRYYEEEGLITIKRKEGTGYRSFSKEDIDILMKIRLYRSIGLPLQEIKAILQESVSPREALQKQLMGLKAQINSLQLKKDLLQSLLSSDKLLADSRNLVFDFEDIIYCDRQLIESKLRHMDPSDIVLAAMGASPAMNVLLQELLPEINLAKLQKEMGKVKIEAIEKAQTDILICLNSDA